jgi:hypothetical protein
MPAIKTSCREIGQIIESKGQLAAIRPKSYLICYRIKSLIVSFHRYYQPGFRSRNIKGTD